MYALRNISLTLNNTDQFYYLRVKNDLLFPDELKSIRLKFFLSYERADSIFGLRYGSYLLYETNQLLHTVVEDIAIRGTNILDSNGNSILPSFT